MTRTCTICSHPERDEIELAVVQSKRYRDIAGLYDITDSALSRHINDHVAPYLARIRDVQEEDRAKTLLDRLDALVSETRAILRDAREEGGSADDRALRAIRRLERQLELEGVILRAIPAQPTININTFIGTEVIQVLTQALRPYPQAAKAVSQALAQIEASGADGGDGS